VANKQEYKSKEKRLFFHTTIFRILFLPSHEDEFITAIDALFAIQISLSLLFRLVDRTVDRSLKKTRSV
jgi:hypothetical protein